ncbi:MAG TPA: aldo/keto reductase [Polyangiaceae bacterium]|jgi:voltage-dependent potassium channel beta subunit|nr:aldo/keto reductase [Polyangiaceae bacterium]
MRYRRLGRSGLKVSELSLGAWVTYGSQVDEQGALECMSAAHDAGVNFFDNAEAYGGGRAEITIGNVLQRVGWRRESLVLSTKIFWGGDGPNDRGLSHKHIIEGVHAALKRLKVEYVDLAFCHRPDPDTPIDETVRAWDILVRQGKVFYWGTSEWAAQDVLQAHKIALEHGLTPPSMEQPQYNMFARDKVEREYLPLYEKLGYGTTTFSPLASGVLSGKYNDGIPKGTRLNLPDMAWLKDEALKGGRIEKVRKLAAVANDVGCSMSQLALAWCLKNPNVSTVITGASKKEQVVENMKAADVANRVTSDVMARIDRILDS